MVSSIEFLNYLNFFCQFYLIFRVFSKKYIAENVSPDYQDRSNFKNPDHPRRNYTLKEKGCNMGLFQLPKLLLTSIKWLLSKSHISPHGLKGLIVLVQMFEIKCIFLLWMGSWKHIFILGLKRNCCQFQIFENFWSQFYGSSQHSSERWTILILLIIFSCRITMDWA